jgi:hypothetical protein
VYYCYRYSFYQFRTKIFIFSHIYSAEKDIMAKNTKKNKKQILAQKKEMAMIEGILEGSPDGIGVVVVRLNCGCRKMAAVAADGEPASKLIIYRDGAESVCDACKEDNGAFMRVTETFIHWVEPEPDDETKKSIEFKVIGSSPN